ncbi:hypothetical protein HYPDE_39138 [Hyphomicrobium denitrificans 1NES1]|uniref:Uncharacterized protein n=1 Tax=Hyphomicrobium denitrificans 1NES1 TaxID=670307 RepID=N0BBA3_9HYPH|nr:DUF1178 family protein [Hyphomicrobium denitrificans]AGK59497.1 hypothetical protein HYPDE_39138 [Hyphomicrobium denitrificans 1NES1]
MIKYRLSCTDGHEFESWFRTIAEYDAQSRSGAVACPLCGSTEITKQPMAPAVVSGRSSSNAGLQARPQAPADQNTRAAMTGALRAFKKVVIENSEDVGSAFAEEARKIHFGEAEERNIRGSTTVEEAQALHQDGIPFGILPPLPEDLN